MHKNGETKIKEFFTCKFKATMWNTCIMSKFKLLKKKKKNLLIHHSYAEQNLPKK